MMYTEYPIFPDKKVHIPTAPTYKKNLKAALELFLNVGGNLEELEKQLEISDDVKLEVNNNQKILEQVTKKNYKELQVEDKQENKAMEDSELDFQEDRNKAENKDESKLAWLWRVMTSRGKDSKGKYSSLHNSDYSMYRKCTTVSCVLFFYFLAFFLIYMNGVVNLLSYSRLFTPYQVSILGQPHTIITPNFDEFISSYEGVEDGSVNVLNETMYCQLDDNLAYYDFVRPASPHWTIYLILSIAAMSTSLLT